MFYLHFYDRYTNKNVIQSLEVEGKLDTVLKICGMHFELFYAPFSFVLLVK